MVEADIRQSDLYNDDLAPVTSGRRKWGLLSFAALWVSMSACIPTYMLASSLIGGGMNWWEAILTIFLGNAIVVIPISFWDRLLNLEIS
jgi:NCS1 family nucleobase:cation symporter-1